MKREDFVHILEEMKRRESDPCTGVFEKGNLGLLVTYVNKQGVVSRGMTLRNIEYPCDFEGCFEADCYSYARANELWNNIYECDKDSAASSRRVFSISRVETAEIKNV